MDLEVILPTCTQSTREKENGEPGSESGSGSGSHDEKGEEHLENVKRHDCLDDAQAQASHVGSSTVLDIDNLGDDRDTHLVPGEDDVTIQDFIELLLNPAHFRGVDMKLTPKTKMYTQHLTDLTLLLLRRTGEAAVLSEKEPVRKYEPYWDVHRDFLRLSMKIWTCRDSLWDLKEDLDHLGFSQVFQDAQTRYDEGSEEFEMEPGETS